MAKYRKKSVVIDAVRTRDLMNAAIEDWAVRAPWLVRAYECGDIVFASDHVSIKTLEGVHRADPDDMIICGIKGELYPCKPDIFAATYDPVE